MCLITLAQVGVHRELMTQVSSVRANLESLMRVTLYMNYKYEGLAPLGTPKENLPENRTQTEEGGAEKCHK